MGNEGAVPVEVVAPAGRAVRRALAEVLQRRGGLAVFAARWVGALRAVMPVVAGISDMRYRRFLAWDVPAVILWTSLVVSVGFYFGDGIAEVVDRIGLTVSLVIVVLVVALIVLRRRVNARARGTTT
jgi:membrane-associated protein